MVTGYLETMHLIRILILSLERQRVVQVMASSFTILNSHSLGSSKGLLEVEFTTKDIEFEPIWLLLFQERLWNFRILASL